jgi:hypothetical protein
MDISASQEVNTRGCWDFYAIEMEQKMGQVPAMATDYRVNSPTAEILQHDFLQEGLDFEKPQSLKMS